VTGQSLPMEQLRRLRQVQSVAAAVAFDRGKMRETDFVTMPPVGAEKKLERSMLGIAGPDTFLYSASRVHWSDSLLTPSAPAAIGLPALVQQFTAAMNTHGISPEDLHRAFNGELELLGNWPSNMHWPTLIATLPVRDAGRARKVVEALASVEIGGAAWNRTEVNGVTFYSAEPFSELVPIKPALAVSDKWMVAGTDAAAVTSALVQVAHPAGELEKSATFRDAAALVPTADTSFNYVDSRLLYERIDAAARPFLLMGAAFYPSLAKKVSPSKLPPAEAITRHLSPIVMSQRYAHDGYVTESVGPVTFREATIGLAAGIGALFFSLQEGLKGNRLLQDALTSPGPVLATPAPTITPSPTPSPF
jgi:hypothetical protein